MRAIIDTNIILDILFQREPFVEPSAAVWLACERGQFEGYISAITPVNIFYIARKIKGQEIAHQLITDVISAFHISPLDEIALEKALTLPMRDFEDAIQSASALSSNIDIIVTRNVDDFKILQSRLLRLKNSSNY